MKLDKKKTSKKEQIRKKLTLHRMAVMREMQIQKKLKQVKGMKDLVMGHDIHLNKVANSLSKELINQKNN